MTPGWHSRSDEAEVLQDAFVYRSLTVVLRRDRSRDCQLDRVPLAGYRMLWPNGREVDVAVDALCRYGQRLLGLDRHLADVPERLFELLCFPVRDPEGPMSRLPGHRVRRLFLHREGPRGRLHLLDGTETQVEFVLGRDDPRVLEWIGLPDAPDRGRVCLDLGARPLGVAAVAASRPGPAAVRLAPGEGPAS